MTPLTVALHSIVCFTAACLMTAMVSAPVIGANIGAGLAAMLILALGMPWSLVYEIGALHNVEVFEERSDAFSLALLGSCMLLNLVIHSCWVARRGHSA